MTFSNTTPSPGSYTITGGTGPFTLTLDNLGSPAMVTNSNGNNTITAPIALAGPATFAINPGTSLTLAGRMSLLNVWSLADRRGNACRRQWQLFRAPRVTFSGSGGTLCAGVGNPSVVNTVSGFAGGIGGGPNQWTQNNNGGSAAALPAISGSTLQLTNSNGGEATTAYYNTQVAVTGGFTASYVFSGSAADGAAFVLQTAGLNALGGGGGEIGYGGVSPSAAFQIETYNNAGVTWASNGATGGDTYIGGTGIVLNANHPISVQLSYDPSDTTLTATLTDQTNSATYTYTSNAVDLASIFPGGTAYLGFSGGTGGANGTNAVSNFTYTNVYGNNLTVNDGVTSTIDVAATALSPTITMGTLTSGSGSHLNVTATQVTATDQAYGLTLGNATLTGITTIDIANAAGGGAGTLRLGNISDGATAGGLVLTGQGTLILSGVNQYTGGTTVDGGILAISNNTPLGSGPLTLSGGKLQIRSATLYGNAVNVAASSSIDVTGPASASLDGTVRIGNTGSTTPITLSVTGGSTGANASYSLYLGTYLNSPGPNNGVQLVGGGTGTTQYTLDVANNGTGAAKVYLGPLADNGHSSTLTIQNAGTVALNYGGTMIAGSTIDVGPASGGPNGGNLRVGTPSGTFATGAAAVNVYNGGTLGVSAGALQGAIGGSTTIESGGTLVGASGVQLFASGGLTLAAGSLDNFTLGSTPNGTANALIATSSASGTSLAISGASTINITNASTIPLHGGTYDLFGYTGSALTTTTSSGTTLDFTNGGGGNLTLGNQPQSTLFTYSLSNNSLQSQIDLIVTPVRLSWTGTLNGNGAPNNSWDTTTNNWANLVPAAVSFTNGSPVKFADTNVLNGNALVPNVGGLATINIAAGGVEPDLVEFDNTGSANGGVDYLFTGGPIGDSSSASPAYLNLIGNGSDGGSVTLANSNTFSGPVTVSLGSLLLDNPTALGNSSGAAVTGDGGAIVLQSTSGSSAVYGRKQNGAGTIGLTLDGAGNAAYPAALTSASGINTYSGPITVGASGSRHHRLGLDGQWRWADARRRNRLGQRHVDIHRPRQYLPDDRRHQRRRRGHARLDRHERDRHVDVGGRRRLLRQHVGEHGHARVAKCRRLGQFVGRDGRFGRLR